MNAYFSLIMHPFNSPIEVESKVNIVFVHAESTVQCEDKVLKRRSIDCIVD